MYQILQTSPHFLPIRQIHTQQDKDRANDEIDRYLFRENQPGKEDGGDGIEVNIIGGSDGAEFLHYPVPRQETKHGGHATEEKQIGEDVGTEHKRGRGKAGDEQIIWYHGEQAVKKHLAGNEHRIVTLIGGNHQQAINRPTKTGGECQCIAQRGEMKHETPIEHHDRHTDGSQQRARHLHGSQSFRLVEKANQCRGEDGAKADDERGVRGCGMVHRLILGQEIERATRYAKPHHPQFVTPCPALDAESIAFGYQVEGKQQDIGNGEAECEYLRRAQAVEQQQLGIDEGGAPDGYHQERHNMVEYPVV